MMEWKQLGQSEWLDGAAGRAYARVFRSGDAWAWSVYGARLQGKPVAFGAGATNESAKRAAEAVLIRQ